MHQHQQTDRGTVVGLRHQRGEGEDGNQKLYTSKTKSTNCDPASASWQRYLLPVSTEHGEGEDGKKQKTTKIEGKPVNQHL